MHRRDSSGLRKGDPTSETELRILRYLADHPSASDTAEGILHWWLLEQRIVEAEEVVARALDDLVDRNLLLADEAADGRQHYRVNIEKVSEIRRAIGDDKGR